MTNFPPDPDYQSLAELRHQIRRFVHFSEQAARAAGLEPRQHQFMLALKGLPAGIRPRIGELAERLQVQHHSAVELANRLAAGGYIRRQPGTDDRREVLLALTPRGEKVLRQLSLDHKDELRLRGPQLLRAIKQVMRHTAEISPKPMAPNPKAMPPKSRSQKSENPKSTKRVH